MNADERRWEQRGVIGVHPRESAAQMRFSAAESNRSLTVAAPIRHHSTRLSSAHASSGVTAAIAVTGANP
jgi:hypothetical protein